MASIPEHIKNLLFEQDCVVVPDFGGFITNFHGAIIHERNGIFLPPRKRIAFNEILQFDDGLLTSYIARKETHSREEALHKIRSFSANLWKELKVRKSFRFENLGVFTLNSEGKLVFEPEHRINFHAESFGMAAVPTRTFAKIDRSLETGRSISTGLTHASPVLEVVTEEVADETPIIEFPNSRRWLTLPNVAASAGIVLLSLVGWVWLDSSNSSLSSLNPLSILDIREWFPIKTHPKSVGSVPALNPSVVQKSSEVPVKPSLDVHPVSEPAPIRSASPAEVKSEEASKPVRSSRTGAFSIFRMPVRTGAEKIRTTAGRYYVIAGGFGKEANARKLVHQLKSKGFENATILYPAKAVGLVKVGVGAMETSEQAFSTAEQVRTALRSSVWILKSK